MIQFFRSPQRAVAAVQKQLGDCQQLDILTGFIGAGASRFLRSLNPGRTRIVFGLDTSNPKLADAQWTELKKLQKLARVRVFPGLHAKLYLLDQRILAIGSANLTRAGFELLQEAVVVSNAPKAVDDAVQFFKQVWAAATEPPRKPTVDAGSQLSGDRAALAILGRRPDPERSAFSAGRRRLRQSGRRASEHDDNGNTRRSHRHVRICAYAAHWLDREDSFETNDFLDGWSTGERAQPGELQLFCTSKNIAGVPELADDPRVDAVHSLWRMAGPINPELGNDEWPIQAPFELVVRFENPVPYDDMVRARLVSGYSWPMGSRGKLLKTPEDVRRLSDLLVRHNPRQRNDILRGLGLRA
ncbi:hypothetical protein RAS1_14500 [Phycisphaerae bacterium RAS1]|nr:hypothetical protein RAS1_14500 [Phycisphaerae bacterium RAS1]